MEYHGPDAFEDCPDCKVESTQDEFMRVVWHVEECFRCTVRRVNHERRRRRLTYLAAVTWVCALVVWVIALSNWMG